MRLVRFDALRGRPCVSLPLTLIRSINLYIYVSYFRLIYSDKLDQNQVE